MGGTEFGEDQGYGPARVLTPEQVRATATGLASLTRDEMRARFRPAELTAHGIYPMVWDEDEEELFEELMMYFDSMVACYRNAAARGDAMLLTLT